MIPRYLAPPALRLPLACVDGTSRPHWLDFWGTTLVGYLSTIRLEQIMWSQCEHCHGVAWSENVRHWVIKVQAFPLVSCVDTAGGAPT